MRAVLVTTFGVPPSVESVPDPACEPDGVIVRVRATGVCRSDWHGWQGHDPDISLPHVPGHEYAGVVEVIGADVRRVRVGDRVIVPFVCACGRCATCRAGAEQVCEAQRQPGFTEWGSWAERVAVPRADVNLVTLPDEMSFTDAAGLGCRFATAYRAITAHARPRPGDSVAVIGCGGVGLAAVMIAAARGAHVVAVDVSPTALEWARRVGAASTVCSGDPVAEVRDITGGGAHAAVDALGSTATSLAGIDMLRPRGRHVQVGLLVGDASHPPVPMATVLSRELEIYGSHGMAARDYPAMLGEIAAGRLNPSAMVGERIELDDLPGALAAMTSGSPVGVQVAELP